VLVSPSCVPGAGNATSRAKRSAAGRLPIDARRFMPYVVHSPQQQQHQQLQHFSFVCLLHRYRSLTAIPGDASFNAPLADPATAAAAAAALLREQCGGLVRFAIENNEKSQFFQTLAVVTWCACGFGIIGRVYLGRNVIIIQKKIYKLIDLTIALR
jgi:hypothetical protein